MPDTERCEAGHAMTVVNRFRFDDEPGDPPHVTATLARFRAIGLELGADVTVWRCDPCGSIAAIFSTPDARPAS
jgi:hypothetical protein